MNKLLFVVLLVVCLLAACGGSAAPQPASQPPAPPADTPTPAPKAQIPANIPVMDGATDLDVSTSQVTYIVKGSLKDVMAYFDKEMPARGWKQQEQPSVISDFGRMYFEDPEHQVSILLNASPTLNQVVIKMNMITLNVFEATATP